MKKILIIESCEECPHFYESLVTTEEMTCNKLKVILERSDVLHKDCPLKDAPVPPLYIVYEFSYVSIGSWNGKWSGEDNYYAVVKNWSKSATNANKAEEIVKGSPYTYNFGDGWVASVNVREVRDTSEARKLREKSAGFCGYEWMIESIEAHGRITPR
jgi:hypothetical protein